VDVVSDGSFIDAGAAIEVTRVDGNRIVVRQPATRHGAENE
jgi:membrane-bound ClpP family serine protease